MIRDEEGRALTDYIPQSSLGFSQDEDDRLHFDPAPFQVAREGGTKRAGKGGSSGQPTLLLVKP